MAVSGRKADIDWQLFEDLCQIHCTQVEIAHILRITTDTLYARAQKHYNKPFQEIYTMLTAGGKASIRRTQFLMAQKHVAMAIWLGKQWLGQRDNEKIENLEAKKSFEDFNALMTRLLEAQVDTQVKPIAQVNAQLKPQVEA